MRSSLPPLTGIPHQPIPASQSFSGPLPPPLPSYQSPSMSSSQAPLASLSVSSSEPLLLSPSVSGPLLPCCIRRIGAQAGSVRAARRSTFSSAPGGRVMPSRAGPARPLPPNPRQLLISSSVRAALRKAGGWAAWLWGLHTVSAATSGRKLQQAGRQSGGRWADNSAAHGIQSLKCLAPATRAGVTSLPLNCSRQAVPLQGWSPRLPAAGRLEQPLVPMQPAGMAHLSSSRAHSNPGSSLNGAAVGGYPKARTASATAGNEATGPASAASCTSRGTP